MVIFEKMDEDMSKGVDFEEFSAHKHTFEALGIKMDDVQEVFDLIDKSQDKIITFDELADYFTLKHIDVFDIDEEEQPENQEN